MIKTLIKTKAKKVLIDYQLRLSMLLVVTMQHRTSANVILPPMYNEPKEEYVQYILYISLQVNKLLI